MSLTMPKRRATNWYVITGGPSSGKTTTVNILHERGYKTTIEHARHYLDTQRVKGHSIEEVRSNHRAFQLGVLEMQIEQEASLSPEEEVFLDRAIPDALAYYRLLDLLPDELLLEKLEQVYYKKVFILETLTLVADYARTEDADTQQRIHQLLIEVYGSLPFPLIHVPVLPPDERVDFILRCK